MLTEVILHGPLADRFGERHRFAVNTALEVLKALASNRPDFRGYMLQNSSPGYVVLADGRELDAEEIPIYRAPKELHLIPVVEGAGGTNGFTKIVIGAALIFMTVASGGAGAGVGANSSWLTGALTEAGMSAGTALAISSAVNALGWSLALQGTAQLLAKDVALDNSTMSPGEDKPSFVYDGPINVGGQGMPIPVIYGMMETGSVVGSFGLSSDEITIGGGSDDPDPSGFRFTSPGTAISEYWSDIDAYNGYNREWDVAWTGNSGAVTVVIEAGNTSGSAFSIESAGAKLRLTYYWPSGNPEAFSESGTLVLRATDTGGHVARRSLSYDIGATRDDRDDRGSS